MVEEESYDVYKIRNDEAEVEYDEYEDDNLKEKGQNVDQNEVVINIMVMTILPPPGLVEIDTEPIEGYLSNWLENITAVKTANGMPTNETPTKSQCQSQSQSLNMDEINISSGLIELSHWSLLNSPDENISNSNESCSTEIN